MQRDFSRLKSRQFDVLICGGGIYGAWTAYDAALRGLKVAIVDQGDWACATSSASSKLIHGGLRYLESFDLKLVRKTLAERRMLLKSAPHRVWPLRFGVPVYKHSRIGSFRLKIGLSLYDLLAGIVQKDQAYHRYSRSDFIKRFPFLVPEHLIEGFTYFDAQTDDARLVLELIDGARTNGAVCLNYCKVMRFLENNGQVCGAEIRDETNGETAKIRAAQVVNTTGRWSATLQNGNLSYRLSKGVHLIMPGLLETEALLLTAETDGRVFFLIPWYGLTLLGTTDTDYHGNIDQLSVDEEDIRYLLTEANRVLKTVNWTEQDIIGRYAGLRVLKSSAEASPSSVSRDWELHVAENGLLSSIGGKLTSARQDAEVIVDTLCQNLGVNASCQTFGKAFPWLPEEDYKEWTETTLKIARGLGIDNSSAQWLLRRHGNRVSGILRLCEQHPELAKRIMPALPFIMADLIFSAQHEMVVHLEDLLRRRMPLLILAKMTAGELERLARIAADALNWDEDTMNNELDICSRKWLIH
ncbi:Glycerol-3-phosphate dehydrogenase [Candidatus Methylobacter favarea]|uniref:Glycerol-3-phosphate dehydrogenase n=1 Tax=Candidatus Methylobacter favarea TaxID=2707345 RepID=A0A8S0WAT4_9GAMM|nr:glycerol-3-phosphate dehydrogenase/oxidase [Candidatus Methylobacter favarea]CAA9891029.1 Glycerol-3-phosphate dehydrogenase [Candidatus Methylobacter favarea]